MTELSRLFLITLVVIFTSIIAATYGFGIYLFPAIAPEMIKDLKFSYAEMGITTGIAQAGFLLFALISGFLASVLSGFFIIKVSIIVCGISLVGLAFSQDFFTASIFLILMGGCAASVWIPMVEISQKYIPSHYQGRALGLMSSGTSYGVFVNSIIIVYLLDRFGWRGLWIFAFSTILLIFTVAYIAFRALEKKSHAEQEQQDLTAEPKQTLSIYEKIRSLPPRTTLIILTMMFLNGLSCMPFQTYLSSFLVDEQNISVNQSAIAWRIIGFVGMFGGFVMGWLADRITVRWTLAITYVLLSASTLILMYSDSQILSIYAAASLFGLAFYAIFGLVPAYISHIYKDGKAALVFAFGNVALGFGGIIGNALGGYVKEESGSFSWIYLTILLAALGSILLSFVMENENIVNKKPKA